MSMGLGAWRAQQSTSADERAAKAQAKAEEDARLEAKAKAIGTLAAGLTLIRRLNHGGEATGLRLG